MALADALALVGSEIDFSHSLSDEIIWYGGAMATIVSLAIATVSGPAAFVVGGILAIYEAWYGHAVESQHACIYMRIGWGGILWDSGVYWDRYCRHS